MTITEVFEKITAGEMAGWALAALFVLLSLIQVSPLKLNPWDNIFAWIGKKMNGATEKRLQEVEKQVSDMWINNHRQCILTFARECRSDISHSSDEWSNVLNVAEEYERYYISEHHEAIISHALFDCVQEIIASHLLFVKRSRFTESEEALMEQGKKLAEAEFSEKT